MNKTSIRVLLTTAALALFVVPVAAIAAAGFTDVADSNVFKADIQWMKDTGVTNGCNPPTNDKFCPNDPVTREQMSAFMHRLATNQTVDAGKLNGKDSPGIAQALVDIGGSLSPTVETFLSIDIDAPAAGYVLVQATFVGSANHINGATTSCLLNVSDVDATLPQDVTSRIWVPSSAASGSHSFPSASSRVYPVANAGTHTFYLVGAEVAGNCIVSEIALTALYIPVAYGDI